MKKAFSEAAAVRRGRTVPRRAIALAAAALLLTAAVLVDLLVFPLRFLIAPLPALAERGTGEMRVHFIDVGQGDSALIEFPDGRTMLVDGGDGSDAATAAVVSEMRAAGLRKLDFVLLTHADADHAGGLAEIVSLFGAETAFMPPVEGAAEGTAFGDFYRAAADAGAEVRLSQMYEAILPADETYFYYLLFLAPLSPHIGSSAYNAGDENEASAVVWLEYEGRSLLLTGDAGEETEERLVRLAETLGDEAFSFPAQAAWGEVTLAPDLASLDFLKAGHHGSSSSTGEALLRMTSPGAVFFSAGAGNGYLHPSYRCIERVRECVPDAEIYRTDEQGTLLLTIRPGGDYAVTYGGF